MSCGSLNVAGAALGAAFSLLLYASIIQGFPHDVERTRYETTEAVVGQNITLPCTIESLPDLKLVNIEWRKKNNNSTKLALFSQGNGVHLFWPNVTIRIENANRLMGSYLHLPEVKKWDSGIYICDIATFPLGSFRRETELKIKDVEIMCDRDGSLEVSNGQNVTIHCQASLNAQYRWTKNKELVSENESLQLLWVTDAHAGVYILTVNTGNETVHKEFTIAVQRATTHLKTDPTTVLLQTESFSVPADNSFPTSLTTGLLTTDANVTWTTAIGSHVTDDSPDVITPGEDVTSFTSPTHFSATKFAVTQTDPYHSTTLSPGSAVFTSTQEMATDEAYKYQDISSKRPQVQSSTSGNITENYERPAATPTLNAGNNGTVVEDAAPSYLAVLIIIPVLVLIAVAGFLYRKRLLEQRMDLPPPFKPPPPPVKYTAARQRDIYTHNLPTSRCNSVTELTNMDQVCINI
nr:PREDICTED: uncharacterized protein LOC109635876 [Paralichthys olivaceus]